MQLTREEVNHIWKQIFADMEAIIKIRAKLSFPIYVEMHFNSLLPHKANEDTNKQKEAN